MKAWYHVSIALILFLIAATFGAFGNWIGCLVFAALGGFVLGLHEGIRFERNRL